MAREIPEVVRAAAGLAATVLDEARKLPETLPGLPVRLIGLAMQRAMKVQQQYAGFVARGDELFTGLRGEDEPGLATFDDDEPLPAPTGFRESAFDRAGDTEPTSANIDLILDEEVAAAQDAPDSEAILDEIAIDELVDQAPTLEATAPVTPSAPANALEAAGKAAKTPAKAAKSAAKATAKAATEAATKATTKAADAAEAVVKLAEPAKAEAKPAEPAKAAKPRKSAKAKRPAEDAAALETALLEAAVTAPGTSGDASPAAAESSTPATSTPDSSTPATSTQESPAGAPTTETPTTPAPTAAVPTAEVTTTAATTSDILPSAGDRAPAGKAAQADDAAGDRATATDDGGTTVATASADAGGGSNTAASTAPRNAPVDGYDSFTVAQLRGRLRGYALSSVEELVAYEQATRARAPYLTMLRNRLEKLEEQAVESSPLAPRGA